NLDRSIDFYRTILALEVLERDDRLCALAVPGRKLLLLFRKGGSQKASVTPGGIIPPHGGDGHLHLAFAIPAAELKLWEEWLTQKGVAIESKVTWPRGGQSLYFRDPDHHLIELATPGIWSIY